MTHLHWMKLYIGDELSNTAHMSPSEIGSYFLLKMHYWRFGCLPGDDERLARIAKVSIDQWEINKRSIGPLFEDDWRDQKLEQQREEAEEKHKARVEAGRLGGRARKQSLSNATSKTKALFKQPEPEPEPDPYPAPEPASDSDPEGLALDKKRDNVGSTDIQHRSNLSHDTMFVPFPKPSSPVEGRSFLKKMGVPDKKMDGPLRSLLGGNLTPYDIEEFTSVRGAA